MSHKTPVQVNIDNERALIQALEEMGYEARVEKHELKAFQWKMDCDVSVIKDGKQLNLGFKKVDNHYEMEADWWGTGINPKDFQEQLNQKHSKHKVKNWFLDNNYKVSYEEQEDGSLVVVGSKWRS